MNVFYEFTNVAEASNEKSEAEVFSMWRTERSKYLVGLLAEYLNHIGIDVNKFPLLSWTREEGINNYQLFPETADNYPVLLSTLTVTQDLVRGTIDSNLRSSLSNFHYTSTDAHDKICLERVSGSKIDWKQNYGTSVFKPSSGTVALFRLVSRSNSDGVRQSLCADRMNLLG